MITKTVLPFKIEADKKSANMTYKGFRGYMPMVGHLAENGLVAFDEFRQRGVSGECVQLPCPRFSLYSAHIRFNFSAIGTSASARCNEAVPLELPTQ